jgi:hypothetical protein
MVSLPLKPKLFLHESFPIPPLGHRLGSVARVQFQEDSVLELVNRRETQAQNNRSSVKSFGIFF